jgi:ribonucleoside-triphosphate reductase
LKSRKQNYLDAVKTTEDFLKKTDWRVKENSNIPFSFSNIFFRSAGEVMSRYTLAKVYPPEVSKAHVDGDLHIHNLYMGIVGYCAGWSLKQLLAEGLSGVPGRLACAPPQHLSTALHHVVNFVGIIQNEWSGAQAFNSLDTLLAPFVRKDDLNYKEVKQALQEFVFGLNVTSRWGGQTPFSNITLDLKVPDDLKDDYVVVGGKILTDTYSDYQEEMDMINRAFLEVMIEGDADKRPFTFPIPTYNITKDFDWGSENAQMLFEMTAKYGIPYFQNFIRSDLDPHEVRAMCCRLLLNLKQFYRRLGGYFGYADKTGSVGVVTLNMPRIGFLSKDENEFFERLGNLMELAKDSLEIKRRLIEENIERGLLPYTKRYLGTLRWHFSTIGLIGMNEACLNFLGQSIATKEGKKFSIKVLKFMRDRLLEFQEETENIYNLEATPAEGTSYRLARIDKEKYPEIITAGERVPYYTNSTHLPVGFTDDIFEALTHQEDLQVLYTGGTVFHGFVGERIRDADACMRLVRKIAENFKIPYFTITPTFSICPNHGYVVGEHFKCPECGEDTEVYSRVVGYLRPVQNWNEGKREEFRQRLEYSERKIEKP